MWDLHAMIDGLSLYSVGPLWGSMNIVVLFLVLCMWTSGTNDGRKTIFENTFLVVILCCRGTNVIQYVSTQCLSIFNTTCNGNSYLIYVIPYYFFRYYKIKQTNPKINFLENAFNQVGLSNRILIIVAFGNYQDPHKSQNNVWK